MSYRLHTTRIKLLSRAKSKKSAILWFAHGVYRSQKFPKTIGIRAHANIKKGGSHD